MEVNKKSSISILSSISFIFLDFLISIIIYLFFKISLNLSNILLTEEIFGLVFSFFSNFFMLLILLKVSINLGIDIKQSVLKLKKDFLNYRSIIFISSLIISFTSILIFYFVGIIGFDIFKNEFLLISLKQAAKDPYFLFLILIVVCILVPLKEEIIIRRFLYVSLRKKYNFWISLIIVSLIFSLIHGSILTAFIYSIFACYIYEKYNTLSITIFVHGFINTIFITINWLSILLKL